MSDKRPLLWEDVCCVINGRQVCIEVDIHAEGKGALFIRGREVGDGGIPLWQTGKFINLNLGEDYFVSVGEDEVLVRKHEGVQIAASLLASNYHDWLGQDLADLAEPGRTVWCELMVDMQRRLRILRYRRSSGEKIPFERYVASAVR